MMGYHGQQMRTLETWESSAARFQGAAEGGLEAAGKYIFFFATADNLRIQK